MQSLASEIITKQHESIFALAVAVVPAWTVFCFALSVNCHLTGKYSLSVRVSCALQAYALLVVDEDHVSHSDLLALVMGSDA